MLKDYISSQFSKFYCIDNEIFRKYEKVAFELLDLTHSINHPDCGFVFNGLLPGIGDNRY